MTLTLELNGNEVAVDTFDADASLLDLLREELGAVGSKDACRQGECGSCTVLLDGEPVVSCLVHASQVAGRSVVTVEGLSREGLTDLQRALVEHGAVQCGFCTPGIVVTAEKLLRQVHEPSEREIREALSGNLCRCTGYQAVVDAVLSVAEERER